VNNTQTLVIKATDESATLAEKHEAFDRLVLAFQDMAYAFAYAVLRDADLAEDAAQQAFITAWQKIAQLRRPEAFPAWLKQIVRSECNRLVRGRRVSTSLLDDGREAPSALEDPQGKVERDELRKTVFAAVENLPLNERIVVTLFYLRGLTHADMSAFLELPATTIAKRLYSARSRLKGKIASALTRDVSPRRPSRNASFADKVKGGVYNEYVGRYRFDKRPELVVTIKREGSSLVSVAAGQQNDLLAAGSQENELRTREFDGRGKFVRNRRGRISHLVYYEFGTEMGRAKKIA
jgi:RNA polymerase sigma factor (sigma-70 family)